MLKSRAIWQICGVVLLLGISVIASAAPPDYFLTCDPDSFTYIYENWSTDHYIPCVLSYGGQVWPECRVRIRGDSSREFPKKSLRVKTDGLPFANGRDVILFNADYEDESYIHTVISTRLFSELGYPCFAAEHARLHLNGGYYGLYLRTENVDEDFLASSSLDPNGSLYKATLDGATLSEFDDIYNFWEKKTNTAAPWDDLVLLRDEINSVSDAEYLAWVQESFDYQQMLKIIVANWWLSNGSTYYHNYYMYHDVNGSGKWTMLPWDMDKTLSQHGMHRYHYTSKHSLPDNPIVERAILDDQIYADLTALTITMRDDIFNSAYIFPIIDSLVLEIEASVVADVTDNVVDLTAWQDWIVYEKNAFNHRQAYLPSQHTDWPRSFRVERTPHAFTDQVTINWDHSSDPQGDPLLYTLRYSTERWWPDGSTWYFTGITDNFFTLPSLPAVGDYYWEVYVEDDDGDDHAYIEGFDSYNTFEVRTGSTLPASITGTVILSESGSPYIASGDVVVEAGAVLEVGPGVEIRLPQDATLMVHGRLDINGSEANPVTIMPTFDATGFKTLALDNAEGTSTLSHLLIKGALAADGDPYYAAVNSVDSDLTLDHVIFESNQACVFSYGGNFVASDCDFRAGNMDEYVYVRQGTALIQRCTLDGIPGYQDGIDLNDVSSAVIRDCVVTNGTGDLLDIDQGTVVQIIGNTLIGAIDKGISVGDGSQATIRNNVIKDCNNGIGVKDSGYVDVDHCTFLDNAIGIRSYEKTVGQGGGIADVTNTIFSQNSTTLDVDALSTATVTWSLSDMELLAGTGNLFDLPLLADPAGGDFNLTAGSPCIDAGDPDGPLDPDDTRNDQGALYYDQTGIAIVINEINYNSSLAFDTDDWVEFYNPTPAPIEMSGMVFKDSDDLHSFVFPPASTLPAHGYLVLCQTQALFQLHFPSVSNVIGDMGFGLSGAGELIRLYNEEGVLLDLVAYDDVLPWPPEPDGNGPTLELIDAASDNMLHENWAASLPNTAPHGSPGERNSVTDDTAADGLPAASRLLNVYPNPFNPSTRITFALDQDQHLSLTVHDVNGRQVALIEEGKFEAGLHERTWEGRDDEGHALASGVYLLRMSGDESAFSRKLLLLK